MKGTFTRKIRIMVGVTCMVCMLMPSFTSYAYYDYNTDGKTIEEASKDPKYWHQGNYVPLDNGVDTSSSCSYFAASYCLVKMGIMDPTKDNPRELRAWSLEDINSRTSDPSDPFHLNPNSLNDRYPNSKFEVSWWTDESSSCANLSKEKLKTWVKGEMKKGYFVALCFKHEDGAHWVTVDYFDDEGNMILADSAYGSTTEPKKFEDPNNFGDHGSYYDWYTLYAMLFKMDGKDPLNCESIYGGKFSTSVSDKEQEEYKQILTDWDLQGMPKYTELYKDRSEVSLADNSVLSLQENNQLANIKENLDTGRLTVLGVFSVLCKVLGIILLIYAMLLIVGSITDKINMWVDVSTIKILTFGRNILITSEDDQDADIKGMVTIKQMAFRIVIVFLIGLLLLTPLPLKGYSLILKLFSKV